MQNDFEKVFKISSIVEQSNERSYFKCLVVILAIKHCFVDNAHFNA